MRPKFQHWLQLSSGNTDEGHDLGEPTDCFVGIDVTGGLAYVII